MLLKRTATMLYRMGWADAELDCPLPSLPDPWESHWYQRGVLAALKVKNWQESVPDAELTWRMTTGGTKGVGNDYRRARSLNISVKG